MPRHRARRATGGRGVVLVAAVAATVLCLGGVGGTYAFWSDTATVQSGSMQAGTLDLMVGGTAADQLAGPATSWTYADLAMPNMVPGSSTTKPLVVRNAGTVDVTYSAQAKVGNAALTGATAGAGLSVTIASSADDLCASSASGTAVVPTTAGAPLLGPRSLAAGAVHRYCVIVRFGDAAPSSMQGSSTTLELALAAVQVGP